LVDDGREGGKAEFTKRNICTREEWREGMDQSFWMEEAWGQEWTDERRE
jgi:hypothetical protein